MAPNISLYLGNDTMQGHIYCGKAYSNSYAIYRMVPFSMTLTYKPYFKSMRLINVGYLKNGTKWICSWITNRNLHGVLLFQWPWVTLTELAKFSTSVSGVSATAELLTLCEHGYVYLLYVQTYRRTRNLRYVKNSTSYTCCGVKYNNFRFLPLPYFRSRVVTQNHGWTARRRKHNCSR